MSLLIENQSYKKKITFYNALDNDKKISISIGLACNHDIDKSMIASIESHIESLFLSNYISESTYKNNKAKAKAEAKNESKEIAAYKKRIGITD
jgi:hypothetical protein